MTKTAALPKTQAAAMDILIDGMSRDEWAAAGANLNAIDGLSRKGLVRREGDARKVVGNGFEIVRWYRVA
jgi:uncharacterized protein YjhX (UPF0386 family)